jgi:hypothetical protein
MPDIIATQAQLTARDQGRMTAPIPWVQTVTPTLIQDRDLLSSRPPYGRTGQSG